MGEIAEKTLWNSMDRAFNSCMPLGCNSSVFCQITEVTVLYRYNFLYVSLCYDFLYVETGKQSLCADHCF